MFLKHLLEIFFIFSVLHVQAQENEVQQVLEFVEKVVQNLEQELSNVSNETLSNEDQIREVINITEYFQNAISGAILENTTTLTDILTFADFENVYNQLISIATRQKRNSRSKGHHHCPPPIIPPPLDSRISQRISFLDQTVRNIRNAIDDACTRITTAIEQKRMQLVSGSG